MERWAWAPLLTVYLISCFLYVRGVMSGAKGDVVAAVVAAAVARQVASFCTLGGGINDFGVCVVLFGLLNAMLAWLPESRRAFPRGDLLWVGVLAVGFGLFLMMLM